MTKAPIKHKIYTDTIKGVDMKSVTIPKPIADKVTCGHCISAFANPDTATHLERTRQSHYSVHEGLQYPQTTNEPRRYPISSSSGHYLMTEGLSPQGDRPPIFYKTKNRP